MTDRELMLHRFCRKNIRKTTAVLARELGLSKEEYEAAVQRGLNEEAHGSFNKYHLKKEANA